MNDNILDYLSGFTINLIMGFINHHTGWLFVDQDAKTLHGNAQSLHLIGHAWSISLITSKNSIFAVRYAIKAHVNMKQTSQRLSRCDRGESRRRGRAERAL